MAIQLTYTSAEIQARLDSAGTALQAEDITNRAKALKATDTTTLPVGGEYNLDNYLTPGNYKCTSISSARDFTGLPLDFTPAAFRFEVLSTTQAGRVRQNLSGNAANSVNEYTRYYNGTSWGAWHRYLSELDIDTTLAASGMAADSAAVGTAISAAAANAAASAKAAAVIRKYVAENGLDSNSGDSAAAPYATIGKALTEGAEVILLAAGNYAEDVTVSGRSLTIIGPDSGATVDGTVTCVNCAVDLRNICATAFSLTRCTGTAADCETGQLHNGTFAGFVLSGSAMTLTRCRSYGESSEVETATANGFTVQYSDHIPDVTLIDCEAKLCKNGVVQSAGKLHIHGGKFTENGAHGVKITSGLGAEIHGAAIYNNQDTGVYASDNSSLNLKTILVQGSRIDSNAGRGIYAKNFLVRGIGCYVGDNSHGNTQEEGSGSVILWASEVTA